MRQNHYAFSPNPWFIAAFFSGQVVLQLAWIRKLFTLDPAGYQSINGGSVQTAEDVEAIQTATEYAPIYALGNLCIGKSIQEVLHSMSSWLASWLALLLAARGVHGFASFGYHKHRSSTRSGGSSSSYHSGKLEAHGPDPSCCEDICRDWCAGPLG